MATFFTTMLAALIGACFSPFIINFLDERKSRLKALEDAYIQSNMLYQEYKKYYAYIFILIKDSDDLKINNSRYNDLIVRFRTVDDNTLLKLKYLLDFQLSYDINEIYEIKRLCALFLGLEAGVRNYIINNQGKKYEVEELETMIGTLTSTLKDVDIWCKREKNKLKWKNYLHGKWTSFITFLCPVDNKAQ